MVVLYYTLFVVGVLISVSFYTLFERKVLGSSHIRQGPQVVGWSGVLQPFSDAIKLFTKEQLAPLSSNYLIFMFSPVIMLFLAIVIWVVVPVSLLMFNLKMGMLLFFIITSASVYAHLGSGWSSNSNYALIGGLRCVAQGLSYEVSLAFLFMTSMFLMMNTDLMELSRYQSLVVFGFMLPPVVIMWWGSSLAETNRSPFDFAEGESELVSGFNVEYGSSMFAIMFIAEYASMIFMSMLMTVIFMGVSVGGGPWFLGVGLFMFGFVWTRVSFPRTRYDKLMDLSWLIILPTTLMLLMVIISLI